MNFSVARNVKCMSCQMGEQLNWMIYFSVSFPHITIYTSSNNNNRIRIIDDLATLALPYKLFLDIILKRATLIHYYLFSDLPKIHKNIHKI